MGLRKFRLDGGFGRSFPLLTVEEEVLSPRNPSLHYYLPSSPLPTGLYIPETVPQVDAAALKEMAKMEYPALAAKVRARRRRATETLQSVRHS